MTNQQQSPSELRLGSIPITSASAKPARFTGLFWGPAGCGKTTLAATIGGRKLILNFDPEGTTSIGSIPNVSVADYVASDNRVSELAKSSANPFDLKNAIEHFDTLIVDSLTNFAHKALMHGVDTSKGATVERPSLQGFGVRTALTTQLVKNILAFTAKYNKNVVFISHEASPVYDKEGNISHIPIALGGQLPESVPLDLSEVWYVHDQSKKRSICIRPARMRKPMKSRMFKTMGDVEFEWKFNAELPYEDPRNKGHRLEDWIAAWQQGNKQKLDLPK